MSNYPVGPKSEWPSQATAIVAGEVDGAYHDVLMLLAWMRDMNWPGAPLIAAHVRALGATSREAVRSVLRSGDSVWVYWVYWVLSELRDAFDAAYWSALGSELCAIAAHADEEGAHIEASYILARHCLRRDAAGRFAKVDGT